MTATIWVKNTAPEKDNNVSQPTMELFQKYISAPRDTTALPFKHQASSFRVVAKDGELFLVAGTASGKTLAVAIPIFDKLRRGQIRRIVLMYPTIALMNDQRQVMEKLAKITGMAVGQIQGGMSRAKVVAELNKPVILATPDAIYWFFQKNVKYSGMLLYGLATVDEWVLDEAHLFSGLMLQNLLHLKIRITELAAMIGRKPRWHVLTATPTPELKIFNSGVIIHGQSKCGDVRVSFSRPLDDFDERDDLFCQQVNQSLANGKRKVLVVMNSAQGAHYLFNKICRSSPLLTPEQELQFGTVDGEALCNWLNQNGFEDVVASLEAWLLEDQAVRLIDLAPQNPVSIDADLLMAGFTSFMQSKLRHLTGFAYEAERQQQIAIDGVRQRVTTADRASQLVWRQVAPTLPKDATAVDVKSHLFHWLEQINDSLDERWSSSIQDVPSVFPQIQSDLTAVGLSEKLADLAVRHLVRQVTVPKENLDDAGAVQSTAHGRRVYLRWLTWSTLIADIETRQQVKTALLEALVAQELEVKPPSSMGGWLDTDVPVVLYSGKMSKRAREGLIELFAELEQAVLISTPAVEVGVDFDAEVLITEECDGNGFLQRFGRVGRSGAGAQVYVLLRSPAALLRLRTVPAEMDREAFSRLIVDPENPTGPESSLFPARAYIPGSAMVDAGHWLINEQIGIIGSQLNQSMFGQKETVTRLANAMRMADVAISYGLRSTMPEIAFRDGASASPFYVLRRIHNGRLELSSSPFEAARADVSYNQFLYLSSFADVGVDWKQTLQASNFIFYQLDGEWHVAAGIGVAEDFYKTMLDSGARKKILIAKQLWSQKPEQAAQLLENYHLDRLARLGNAVLVHGSPAESLLLGQGPVYLEREVEDGGREAVESVFSEPVVLPDQVWLVMIGDKDKNLAQLNEHGLMNLEELYVDSHGDHIVLLEQIAGACLYVYERLNHVG